MKNFKLIEKTILFAICIYLPVASFAQAGSLDISFGDSGIVTTNITGNNNNVGSATAIQSDGKILVAGYSISDNNKNNFNLVRYNTNGDLDNTFGAGGIVNTNEGIGYALAIQSDGKILVAGSALIRYNTNGSLDSTFGNGGICSFINNLTASSIAIQSDSKIVLVGIGYTYNNWNGGWITSVSLFRFTNNGIIDSVFSAGGSGLGGGGAPLSGYNKCTIAIQNDGKFLVTGKFTDGIRQNLLIRFNNNGSLDSTFGSLGIVTTYLGFDYITNDLAIQNDGKIVLAAFNYYNTLTRFKANGSVDSTFGSDGIVGIPIYNFAFGEHAISVQSDGKILVAGSTYEGANFVLARYTTNGNLDNSFGIGGIVYTIIGHASNASSIAIQGDGKIIIVGTTQPMAYTHTSSDIALVRYTTNGVIDTSFNNDGIVITNIGIRYYNDIGYTTTIQGDGKILVVGYSGYDIALVRYTNHGGLDTTFGNRGIVTTVIRSNIGDPLVIQQSDGKILVAGSTSTTLVIFRYNTNGSLDSTFGNKGNVNTSFLNSSLNISAIVIQSDSKILVAGSTWNGAQSFILIRYTSNGSLDNSFGDNGIVATDNGGTNALTIQSDGKIVIAGFYLKTNSERNFALARYNTNGSLDNTFGNFGIVTTDLGRSQAMSIAIQSDGSILVAGSSDTAFALVQYTANGSLDITFGNNGIVTTHNCPNTLTIQKDGKILVVGGYSNDTVITIVRYTNNGGLDNTFGSGGINTKTIYKINFGIINLKKSLAIQSDGKIVMAGFSKNDLNINSDFRLIRYKNDNTSGINKNTEINIFPNPTTGNIYLSVNANIILTDLLGKLLLEQKNTKHLDISALPAGMYFLRYGDNLKQTFKVIKE